MGKKAKLYLLVIINLAVWGYVGYKVYGALQGDEDPDLTMDQAKIKKIEPAATADSVVLLLNYEDPFLKNGNFSQNRKHISSAQPSKNPPLPKPVVAKAVPTSTVAAPLNIQYLGLIKNSTGNSTTALLSINGKSSFVKQNDVIEGYTVKEISGESILLLKGKEKLFIRK